MNEKLIQIICLSSLLTLLMICFVFNPFDFRQLFEKPADPKLLSQYGKQIIEEMLQKQKNAIDKHNFTALSSEETIADSDDEVVLYVQFQEKRNEKFKRLEYTIESIDAKGSSSEFTISAHITRTLDFGLGDSNPGFGDRIKMVVSNFNPKFPDQKKVEVLSNTSDTSPPLKERIMKFIHSFTEPTH